MNQMNTPEPITLERDCPAALIPDGTPIVLPQGSVVFMTQSLGGSYTVNFNGNLARIEGKHADALGFEAEEEAQKKELTGDGTVNEEAVWDALRDCYDPEIPINMVDLGLIYDCRIIPQRADSDYGEGELTGNKVHILMTLTAPGCGMGQFIADDVQRKVAAVDNVTEVDVELTFDPPWSFEMMSEAARLETGML
ncbi:putative FeS assembly SUF system protein SufT [Methylohalomonas lacus]|uniref:FeS assembly SUF system protein SufT n=2 Tax=Methylohalomonas lacus TaxID=398773 RepID=A0AAE3HJ59_9GAMM|nr:putative FeS assembly SUF system protein SufT [Methylohalomonas lacus]